MAELPARVRVGPFVYTVASDAVALREAEHASSPHIHGGCNNNQLRIVVDTSYPPGQQRDTLWHEVKHAVNYLADFGGKDRLDEEGVVGRTSSLELMVLRDNPALLAFLLEADDAPEEVPDDPEAHG